MTDETAHKCVYKDCSKPPKGNLTCCEEHAGASVEGCQ